jgi:hypothetical protein
MQFLQSEVYLNPFIYPQIPKLDTNGSITYSVKEYENDGTTRILEGEVRANLDLFEYLHYGFGSYTVTAEIGETDNAMRFKFNFGINTHDIFRENDSYLVFRNRPSSKYINNGDTWNEVLNSHGTFEHNETTWVRYKTETNSTHQIDGTSLIQTPWGSLEAIKVVSIFDSYTEINPSDEETRFISYAFVSRGNRVTSYYINGLGLYSSKMNLSELERRETGSNSTRNEALARNTYSDLFSEPVPNIIETKYLENYKILQVESEFKTTSLNLDIKGYNSSTTNNLDANLYLDSWIWNGAFPWVYNSVTDSWFYYYFGVNTCIVYDSRAELWYSYDSETGEWLKN